ncbi:mitochondrial import inner membrane translocase subunit Tim10-like [Oppia nitens]|uniref:mitochondrial import inner membrane translocase subunit Tim10-like n=1 Tax=Oppia nitens TaxID=1686743 RepID=UPI0023DCAA05|nr:mitochondrial import inner membrane translocase subunit Tim10-like [Oppia nitens]
MSGPPGAGLTLDASKMQLVADLEIEMMSDMYNRMTRACHRKCIPPKYRDSELNKGESVCIDRCVAKYLDIHEKIGKKLTTLSLQDEDMMKKLQQQDNQTQATN